MKLIEDGNRDAPVHLSFDAAMAGLASGAYEPHVGEFERGPDQPAAQMPKPGTDPLGGKEEKREGEVLTNLADTGISDAGAPGLPKEPSPPAQVVVQALKAAQPPKAEPSKADDKKS